MADDLTEMKKALNRLFHTNLSGDGEHLVSPFGLARAGSGQSSGMLHEIEPMPDAMLQDWAEKLALGRQIWLAADKAPDLDHLGRMLRFITTGMSMGAAKSTKLWDLRARSLIEHPELWPEPEETEEEERGRVMKEVAKAMTEPFKGLFVETEGPRTIQDHAEALNTARQEIEYLEKRQRDCLDVMRTYPPGSEGSLTWSASFAHASNAKDAIIRRCVLGGAPPGARLRGPVRPEEADVAWSQSERDRWRDKVHQDQAKEGRTLKHAWKSRKPEDVHADLIEQLHQAIRASLSPDGSLICPSETDAVPDPRDELGRKHESAARHLETAWDMQSLPDDMVPDVAVALGCTYLTGDDELNQGLWEARVNYLRDRPYLFPIKSRQDFHGEAVSTPPFVQSDGTTVRMGRAQEDLRAGEVLWDSGTPPAMTEATPAPVLFADAVKFSTSGILPSGDLVPLAECPGPEEFADLADYLRDNFYSPTLKVGSWLDEAHRLLERLYDRGYRLRAARGPTVPQDASKAQEAGSISLPSTDASQAILEALEKRALEKLGDHVYSPGDQDDPIFPMFKTLMACFRGRLIDYDAMVRILGKLNDAEKRLLFGQVRRLI